MMKRLTALFIASTLALGAANLAHTANAATALSGSKPIMMHHGGGPGQHDMVFKDLNPTDAQRQQIHDIMKSQRENIKRPSLNERRTMHDSIASGTLGKTKAEAQINKMGVQHKMMALPRLETQNKIYSILTPEQKRQFNTNFERHLIERNAPADKMPTPAE